MKKLFNKIRSNKILIKLFSFVLIFGVLASCFIFPSAAAEASSVPLSKLSGTWVFNDTPALPSTYLTERNLKFTVPTLLNENTTVFNILTIDSSGIAVGTGDTLDAGLYNNGSWTSGYDRKIYFDGIQIVSDEFYTWFTTNAKPKIINLTGYTVTVPADWTAPAGYGLYSIEGTYINENGVPFVITYSPFEPQNFGIGYHNDGSIYQLYPDEIGIHILTHVGGGRNISNGEPFSLSITGGSDTSTSSLIQWFEDNDATFAITEPSYVVPSGMYRLDIKSFPFTTSNDLFHLYFDFSTISQDSFDGITIDTSLYNGSRYISDVYYYFPDEEQVPVILDDGPPGSPHYVTKSEGYTFIYLSDDVDLGTSENLSLFNSLFTPFSGDYDDAILFYALGDIDGETSGYKSGYLVGLDEGLSQDLGQTLLGNTLEAPMKALNSFTLYETSNGFTITLGGVIGGAICLTLFIAFLKIFAGG